MLSQAPASLKLRYESGCWRFALATKIVALPQKAASWKHALHQNIAKSLLCVLCAAARKFSWLRLCRPMFYVTNSYYNSVLSSRRQKLRRLKELQHVAMGINPWRYKTMKVMDQIQTQTNGNAVFSEEFSKKKQKIDRQI